MPGEVETLKMLLSVSASGLGVLRRRERGKKMRTVGRRGREVEKAGVCVGRVSECWRGCCLLSQVDLSSRVSGESGTESVLLLSLSPPLRLALTPQSATRTTVSAPLSCLPPLAVPPRVPRPPPTPPSPPSSPNSPAPLTALHSLKTSPTTS